MGRAGEPLLRLFLLCWLIFCVNRVHWNRHTAPGLIWCGHKDIRMGRDDLGEAGKSQTARTLGVAAPSLESRGSHRMRRCLRRLRTGHRRFRRQEQGRRGRSCRGPPAPVCTEAPADRAHCVSGEAGFAQDASTRCPRADVRKGQGSRQGREEDGDHRARAAELRSRLQGGRQRKELRARVLGYKHGKAGKKYGQEKALNMQSPRDGEDAAARTIRWTLTVPLAGRRQRRIHKIRVRLRAARAWGRRRCPWR